LRKSNSLWTARWIGMVVMLCVPALSAFAQEEGAASIDSGDTAWMLASSALVLLMTPGLAFFYGGLVRRKNTLSVLMQCFMCMCLMTVLWVVVGYSLAFSGTSVLGGVIGNLDHLFLRGVGFEARDGLRIPDQLFMVFQGMFAVITPALILGAFAERLKFGAFCLFMALWLVLVYCPVCHWVWGGASGFWGLGSDGALDFAGGTVVHINAGIAALVTAIVLGRRQGWPGRISPPHSLPLAVLGAGMLWFGWFGFNAGSAGGANEQAVNAFVVTNVAAATAGLAWATIDWAVNRKPTVLGIITGAVAGLVAITPAAGYVNVVGALGIGAGASLISYLAVNMKEKLGYDDSLDVFGVHCVAGIWGALATGLWATTQAPGSPADGLFYGNAGQVLLQGKAVAFTIVWSGVISFILLKVIDAVVGLRVSDHEERVGLDLTDHAEVAYTLVD
jgi:Amt family ammonium transporter